MRFVITILALTLCGCAATKPGPTFVEPFDRETFDKGFVEVWQATLTTLAEESLPIVKSDSDSGVVATAFVALGGPGYLPNDAVHDAAKLRCLFCDYTEGRYKLTAFVSRIDDGRTDLRVTAHIEAYTAYFSGGWGPLESKTLLEAKIVKAVRSKLGLEPRTALDNFIAWNGRTHKPLGPPGK